MGRLTSKRGYRQRWVDPRIGRAVEQKINNPRYTFRSLSLRFFGTTSRADSIRKSYNLKIGKKRTRFGSRAKCLANVTDGYQLCARCGHVLTAGAPALVTECIGGVHYAHPYPCIQESGEAQGKLWCERCEQPHDPELHFDCHLIHATKLPDWEEYEAWSFQDGRCIVLAQPHNRNMVEDRMVENFGSMVSLAGVARDVVQRERVKWFATKARSELLDFVPFPFI